MFVFLLSFDYRCSMSFTRGVVDRSLICGDYEISWSCTLAFGFVPNST